MKNSTKVLIIFNINKLNFKIMKLENYVAQTAKKILKVNKANGDEIGLFKDTNENTTFYCVAWHLKGDEIPKFRFFIHDNEAFEYLNRLMILV